MQVQVQPKIAERKRIIGSDHLRSSSIYEFRKGFSREVGANQSAEPAVLRGVRLERCLWMFSALIFDSGVVPGVPSLAAAPDGPDTRPRHSRKDLNQGFLLSRTPVQGARLDIQDTGHNGRPLDRQSGFRPSAPIARRSVVDSMRILMPS